MTRRSQAAARRAVLAGLEAQRRARYFAMVVVMADHVDASASVRRDCKRRALAALVANVTPTIGRPS